MLAGLLLFHLITLHVDGSSNPLGVRIDVDKISFHPYYVMKDLYGVLGVAVVWFGLVCIFPNGLGDPENYKEANSLVTPVHIQPE